MPSVSKNINYIAELADFLKGVLNNSKFNNQETNMKNILKLILSGVILFGSVPTAYASSDMNMAGMEEIKKKKKKKGKKLSQKGKKKKKGFFSKVFGSK